MLLRLRACLRRFAKSLRDSANTQIVKQNRDQIEVNPNLIVFTILYICERGFRKWIK
jgi:hypothetical protein